MHNGTSVQPDGGKLRELRQSIGWTQDEASARSGYSTRLIRKIEAGGRVRPATLIVVLQCYLEWLKIKKWEWSDYLDPDSKTSDDETLPPSTQQPAEMVETMKAYYENVYNRRQIDWVDKYIGKEIVFHAEGTMRRGREVIRQRTALLLAAFDPIEIKIDQSYASGTTVLTFWSFRMKHSGPFVGIEATGRWVSGRANSRCRFEDGLVVEAEDQWDVDHVIRQLTGESPRII